MGTQTVPGWDEQLMLSTLTAQVDFETVVPAGAANFQKVSGFLMIPQVEDIVINDMDEVTGSEVTIDQDIIEKRMRLPYSQPKSTPNMLAFLAAAALGARTKTQDASLVAWKHYITPATVGTELAAFSAVHKRGGLQKSYKGCKVNSFKISSEKEGIVSVEADIVTDGSRTVNADAFVSKITETWMRSADVEVYIKQNPDPARYGRTRKK